MLQKLEDDSVEFFERLAARGREPVELVFVGLEFMEFAPDIFDAAAFEFL